jgi:hypothetical protein
MCRGNHAGSQIAKKAAHSLFLTAIFAAFGFLMMGHEPRSAPKKSAKMAHIFYAGEPFGLYRSLIR